MSDAPEDAPAEASVLDSLSDGSAEMLEKIKGLTLLEAAELIKDVEDTFGLGPKEEEEEEAEAEA